MGRARIYTDGRDTGQLTPILFNHGMEVSLLESVDVFKEIESTTFSVADDDVIVKINGTFYAGTTAIEMIEKGEPFIDRALEYSLGGG